MDIIIRMVVFSFWYRENSMKDELQAAVIFPIFCRQRDLGLTLGGVAVLTSTQMVLTNVAAPFWGIIADRGLLQRRSILTLGCLGDAWNANGPWVGGSVGFRHDQTWYTLYKSIYIYDMYITYEKIGVIYVCRCICIHIHTYVGVEPTKIGWYMGFKQTANVGWPEQTTTKGVNR